MDILKADASADIFIQNFRPGTIDRMGLGYEKIKKLTHIIYVSISGFGEKVHISNKGCMISNQALSGLADIQRDQVTAFQNKCEQ